MKNFIENDHSCSDEKFEACTGKGRCVQIKKTRNSVVWAGVVTVILTYFLLIPNAEQIKSLSKQVGPVVSLYSNPKSLQDKFPLINDDRKTLSLAEATKGKWAILYFGYTSCLDECLKGLTVLNQMLGKMQHANKLQIVFISIDPKQDVGNLSTFAKRFNADFIGLSAEDKALAGMIRMLGIKAEKNKQTTLTEGHKKTNSNYLINHATNYFLLNPDLELTGLLAEPYQPDKTSNALDLIIKTLD